MASSSPFRVINTPYQCHRLIAITRQFARREFATSKGKNNPSQRLSLQATNVTDLSLLSYIMHKF